MLVNRLMRLSQQERRIAVQLLQARHEKEIIRNNRVMREKANEERRQKDFEDALNREAVSSIIIWASPGENLSSGVCGQHRRRPACASAQSGQRLCYSLFGMYRI